MKSRELMVLKKEASGYGGDLRKTRRGRACGRPLAVRGSMHLVLRSTKARGEWSFRKTQNARKIKEICEKFAHRNGIRILSLAIVGNHLHLHVKLSNRHTYPKFIRAVTASIAMAVTGACRWRPLKKEAKDQFWDYRPFTRIVASSHEALNLRDYIRVNELEGFDYHGNEARWLIKYVRAGSTR